MFLLYFINKQFFTFLLYFTLSGIHCIIWVIQNVKYLHIFFVKINEDIILQGFPLNITFEIRVRDLLIFESLYVLMMATELTRKLINWITLFHYTLCLLIFTKYRRRPSSFHADAMFHIGTVFIKEKLPVIDNIWWDNIIIYRLTLNIHAV